ncbi:MAG: choice-of-anchor D domain-containing protein [Myxococcales bacterium]|nr:choice-of-anchor D domain-containing protein [Myxococcales bacterium]
MRTLPVLTLLVVLGASSCGKEKLVAALCRADDDCEAGFLCENYECVPREAKACTNVLDGNPILQPTPHVVDFGTLDAQAALLQTVTLHNIGNCTLTLFEANLKEGAPPGFSCDVCGTAFPKEIFPGRAMDLSIAYTPTAVQSDSTELILLSDDKEYPTLRVPVHANYVGTPQVSVTPNPVDFGYTAEGRLVRKTVSITNQGTGTAPITITAITLSPTDTMDFELVPGSPLPLTLVPVGADRGAVESLEVRYHPRSLAEHTADLVITTSRGTVTVPMKGNSSTPPKITTNPAMIDLGDVALGTSKFKTLTIVNEGGAPLTVTQRWGGMNPTTDLYTTPQVVPAIAPGMYVEVQVAVTATQTGAYSGLLLLETNDPQKPSVTIPVTANGVPGPGPAVVKLEMTYENGSDTAFDNDVRNVDMTLEHPFGYVCNKQTPSPTNWGAYGTPTWLAFAPKEEPERIVLADAMQDGTWRVMISYQADCSSLPTQLLAGLLGISVDLLIDYLTGGVVNIPGQDIGQLISQICLSTKGTNVNVKAYVNGTLIGERQASLARKGDSTYALDLVRTGGTFTIR